ncbi:exportin-5-like [Littorina saxatilis]|uniref:Importin N-terminal domain-containing protein n=1 Tax=Littorina saxatilis TaxID=31220 RepID=A0AAN9GDZ5_9CAEN
MAAQTGVVNMEQTLSTLVAAVEAVMNPAATQQDRAAAHQVCEEFREKSPACLECGLVLAGQQNSPIVRHFGLQLVEHFIKFRWTEISDAQRDTLKTKTLELIDQGTFNLLKEEAHVKDAVSRILVELMKRVWPQLWPDLFQNLNEICQHGATQTELVLKVFLRLVEDVVAFQTIPPQRRREILQALTSTMQELFHFFLQILDAYCTPAASTNKEEAVLVCQSVLSTLTGFVDWVNISHIIDDNGRLLRLLCEMLSDQSLQLHAAECLLLIVGRKGKVEDRKPILVLFSPVAMKAILDAAEAASRNLQDEHHYLFLKRLCQVLTEIGRQLCAQWGQANDIERPEEFDTYLKALLAFTQHPSLTLRSFTFSLWTQFLRHPNISQDSLLQSFLPRLTEVCTTTLYKVGFPSMNNSPSCEFSRIDFDNDEDFQSFFTKYRCDLAETIRSLTLLVPELTFTVASQWLQKELQKPLQADRQPCSMSSPEYLEWEALTVFTESVMLRLFQSEKPLPDVSLGIELLNQLLGYQNQDPLIQSCVLSCMSALFPFLRHGPKALPAVLEMIFASVVFTLPGQTKSTRSRAVKGVRQHACSVLVKICKEYPDILFPEFEHLYVCIKNIDADPDQLSQMERCILIEALIIVSNQFADFERQSVFIAEVLAPVKQLWVSPQFTEAFSHPSKFMSYIGLDQKPVQPSSADTCGINRSHIMYCINMILACMKRTTWPRDTSVAERGGFVLCKQEDGSIILRNPATTHIQQFLDNLFALIKTFCCLWLPEFVQLRHPEFSKAYDLMENERLAALGIQPPSVDNADSFVNRQPLERMQNFISVAYDNCFHILGNAGQCLGHEFYSWPNLGQVLVESVFRQMEHLPDYRLKPVIRAYMKPYISNCPKQYYMTAVVPVLCALCPSIYQRLSAKWVHINQRFEEGLDDDDDNAESQEVLEDQLTRQLTREYLELIGTVCVGRHSSKVEVAEETAMDEGDTTAHNRNDRTLSELGAMCLKNEALFPSILLCVLSGLTWSDTITCSKCIGLCWLLVKQLMADQTMTNEGAVHVLRSVLTGLRTLGQHEATQANLVTLSLTIYEEMRPQFPGLQELVASIPDCSLEAVQNFEKSFLMNSTPTKAPSEKKKKEAFKKLIGSIIGKDLGQMFKREVHYKNLPPMFVRRPKKQRVEVLSDDESCLCALFAADDV